MRLLSTEVRGLLAIKEARIDYSQLGQVVALVGVNGAGKTTMLESPIAALYRGLASRSENVADLAKGRDAYVESVFQDDDGAEWRARIAIDAEKRKVEQHLLRNGKPVTTGRAAEVEKAVRKHFGSLDALLASVFCAQDRAGEFTGLGKAERKALLVEALGLNLLQERCEAARERVRGYEGEIATLQAQALALDAKQLALQAAEAAMDAASSRRAEWTEIQADRLGRAREATAALQDLRVKAEAAAGALAALERAKRAQQEASARADRAAQARKRVEDDVAQRTKRLQYRRDNLQTKAAHATVKLADLGPLELARDEAAGALLNAETALEACRSDYEEARRAATAAAMTLSQRQSAQASEERHRQGLATQAGLLDRVPCTANKGVWLEPKVHSGGAEYVDLAGTCPLLSAAQAAHKELGAPAPDAGVLEATEAEAQAQARVSALTATGLEAKAAREAALEAHRAALEALEQAKALNSVAEDKLRAQREAAEQLAALAEEETSTHFADTAALDNANADRMQADCDLEAAEQELRAAAEQAQGKAVGQGAIAAAEAQVAIETKKHNEAGEEARAAEIALAKAQAAADAIRVDLEAAAAVPDQLRQAQDAQADWQVLADALGRDGIQALEIDAAGPGIAELCNELLASCYGPRFSLRFETLRQNKTNDGAQEVFDIVALDNGEERRLEALSGGEKVIVREALALALAIWNARRSGVRWRTIIRDETAGALSEFNALAYVTMLRRALDLGGFVQVIFISHQREVTARADSIVLVEDGTARVA